MNWLGMLVGVAILFWGRRLFWLFVGGVGFAMGINLATRLLSGQAESTIIVIALVLGVLGALLAITVQRLAISVAGFFAGGYITLYLLNALSMSTGPLDWLYALIGGIIGVFLISALFDWALIILSSITGAVLIMQTFTLDPTLSAFLVLALTVLGIGAQSRMLRGGATHSASPGHS
ncbi:MAG: DUF4203 domain-containing protein [Chloroflexales bacterium]|nr:DUF4203 domain-containing protein [Chloroflexales bacterium]